MEIVNGRATLALHELAHKNGLPLLLLHALYGSSDDWGELPSAWPGSVYALDFAGHGRSAWLKGGAYYSELFLADADCALSQIGRAAVIGIGLGAYVALLLSGARADRVVATLLLPGAGLDGVGPLPVFDKEFPNLDKNEVQATCDPLVRAVELDVRPVDYAESFARAARRLVFLEDGRARPPWWEAARRSPAAETVSADLPVALARLAALAS